MVKIIFYDADTQNDFINVNGALHVKGFGKAKTSNLEALTRTACKNHIPIFGSVVVHFGTEEYKERELELKRNGGSLQDHCMYGTQGRHKIRETLCSEFGRYDSTEWAVNTMYIENPLRNELICSEHGMRFKVDNLKEVITKHLENLYESPSEGSVIPGIFFEKQHYDVRTNPYFQKAIEIINPEKVIIYGVSIEPAIEKFQELGVEIYLVKDAVKGIDKRTSNNLLKKWKSEGVKLVTTKDIVEGKLIKTAGARI